MAAQTPMSLRLRVLVAIALVLAPGAAGGAVFAGWLARQTVRAELTAAMVGGRQTVERAVEVVPRSDHADRDMRQLVATFDGNRHVIAQLVGANGAVVASSQPPPAPSRQFCPRRS